MFIVIKKKMLILIALILCVALCLSIGVSVAVANAVPAEFTVVLDAGHGGIDSGVKGASSGTKESDLNLIITKKVEKLLKKQNIKVVLTRKTEKGLYGDEIKNFKDRDFKKRKEIINEAKPDVMVSIHCNKFPDKSRRGAQVFFEQRSENSPKLAAALQNNLNVLNKENINKEYAALKGDYYMLKCSPFTSVIVECGFLSNMEDDVLLNKEEYQDKVAYAIFSGIIAFADKPTLSV